MDSSVTQKDADLNGLVRYAKRCRFKWTRPLRQKMKSDFCACAITFQTQSTYCECVFGDLGIQHAMYVHALYFRVWPAQVYKICLHYLINGMIFGGGGVWNMTCILIFPKTLSEAFLIVGKTERRMIKNVYWSLCKVPFI
jgi:hypothetical protein